MPAALEGITAPSLRWLVLFLLSFATVDRGYDTPHDGHKSEGSRSVCQHIRSELCLCDGHVQWRLHILTQTNEWGLCDRLL